MKNKTILLILFVLFLLTLLIRLVLVPFLEKKEKKSEENFIIKKNKISYSKYLYKMYLTCSKLTLTKNLVHKIERRFIVLLPGEKKKIGIKTAEVLLTIFTMWLTMIITMIIIRPNLYTFICGFTILYCATDQIIIRKAAKLEGNLIKQFQKFLGDVRHNYIGTGTVESAIYDSIETADYEMSLHGNEIYKILTAVNIEEEVARYSDVAPNNLFKTFVSLCVTTIEKGDKTINGQSLFLMNLLNLKREANYELLKMENIDYKFSGLVFTALFPMFFLQLIEMFAVKNIPELGEYYNGMYGIGVSILIFVITLFSYSMINKLKDNYRMEVKEHIILDWVGNLKPLSAFIAQYQNKNYGKTLALKEKLKQVGESITVKQFMVKSILYCVCTFIFAIGFFLSMHQLDRERLLTNSSSFATMNSFATEKQQEELDQAVLNLTNKYKKEDITRKMIEQELIKENIITNKRLMTLTIDEVFSRVKQYQQEYFKWYELLLSILFATIAYFIPYYALSLQKKAKRLYMEEEVSQFQTVIIMLMHIENITAFTMLEWMETFAVVFKPSIQKCMNEYNADDIKALETLKESESFEPFRNIVDNLLKCDKIGTERAFDEIEVERGNFQETRKLENDIYIEEKSQLGYFLAYLPLNLTVWLYLIIPFVMESLYQLVGYTDLINQL